MTIKFLQRMLSILSSFKLDDDYVDGKNVGL